ncbi:MAG: polysaccharide biosynthesis tyrosine autokinase [Bacteroidetes bacterium]|nr:polysaccharide biosynthesis tyrosine autokinase [Bacteroidota bacterium]
MKLTPVSPNKSLNLGIAFFIGLILPFAGFGAKNFMDNSIKDEFYMRSITKLPSIGRIYHYKKKKHQSSILIDMPRSAIAESFRSVRTNIEYFLEGKRKQVILITSTMTGEGKSFCSMNLATSMALLNRRTVLVDFDVRKPNLHQSLNVNNELGMSSFLNGKAKMEDIIVNTEIPNLDFIPAGPIPFNPAELISSERTEDLLTELGNKYDYIIIDTPPLGLVTEAFLLMKYADLKLFVVREGCTSKKQLSILLNELESKKINNIFWLYNDVDVKGTEYGKKNAYYTND